MNQKCQRKREEEASLLANAVDNQPMSSQTISKAPATTEAAPAEAAPATTEAAPATTEAAPATTEAAPAEAAPAEAAPATTDVSVPVPEQPKKLVGRLVFP